MIGVSGEWSVVSIWRFTHHLQFTTHTTRMIFMRTRVIILIQELLW